jgi:hypothetical protein
VAKNQDNVDKPIKDSGNPDFIVTSDLVNKMKSDKVKGKGASNEANLMRLSLNVQNNMLKENSDYLGIIDNKDVKLKNIDEVIDMGENMKEDKENKNPEPGMDELEEEDFTKSVNEGKSPNNASARSDFRDAGNKSQISDKNIESKSKSFTKSGYGPNDTGKSTTKSVTGNVPTKETLMKEFQVLQPYLIHQTDRVVKPIIGNPEIEKLDEFVFYPELTSNYFPNHWI